MHSASLSPTSQTTSGIRLEDVTLTRGATLVFQHLTLALDEPRIGLIGDNGAGKSSLFRLLCGLDRPDTGRVVMPQPNHSVGMMFQNADEQIIFPTVEEELALSLHHLKLPRAEVQTRVAHWLADKGLAHWAKRAIASLSQGQRQHVCWLALRVASHHTLLLDEPFSSLDLPSQALLRQDMAQTQEQIIVSTHVLDHVRHFERVLWLDKGHIRGDGDGASVCAAYEADVASRTA